MASGSVSRKASLTVKTYTIDSFVSQARSGYWGNTISIANDTAVYGRPICVTAIARFYLPVSVSLGGTIEVNAQIPYESDPAGDGIYITITVVFAKNIIEA